MACTLTDRSSVRDLVLEVICDVERSPNITEDTRFEEDLGVDPIARRGYYPGIREKVEARGCRLSKVGPEDFARARDVRAIVDAVWKDLRETTHP